MKQEDAGSSRSGTDPTGGGASGDSGRELADWLERAGLEPLPVGTLDRLGAYIELLERWNAHMNLTAVRDRRGILTRHLVESIACAQWLPAGTATLADFGSGAGLPGIPIALVRPEIRVTLIEAQARKASFLREAARTLGGAGWAVAARRGESMVAPDGSGAAFDAVSLRAVDAMAEATRTAARLVRAGGWLVVLTTRREVAALTGEVAHFRWEPARSLPLAEERVLVLGRAPR